jgi:hypothetical protein
VKKNEKLFKNELNNLLAKNIIDNEEYERIRQYYESRKEEVSGHISNTFAVIGIILVALGFTAFIAMNWVAILYAWDNAGLIGQMIMALIPVSISLVWGIFTLEDEKKSKQRKMVSALFPITLVISFALITQAFNLDVGFETVWFLSIILFIPFMLLFDELPGYIIYAIGVLIWSSTVIRPYHRTDIDSSFISNTLMYITFMLPIIYKTYINYQKNIKKISTNILYIISVIFVVRALGIFNVFNLLNFIPIIATIYLLTVRLFLETNFVARASSIIIIIAAYFMSLSKSAFFIGNTESSLYYLSTLLFGGAIISLLIINKKVYTTRNIIMGSFGLVSILYILFNPYTPTYSYYHDNNAIYTGYIAYSSLLIFLGIHNIVNGFKNYRSSEAISGVLLISIVIVSKFFDLQIGFGTKSLLFIIAGITFILIANSFNKTLNISKEAIDNETKSEN